MNHQKMIIGPNRLRIDILKGSKKWITQCLKKLNKGGDYKSLIPDEDYEGYTQVISSNKDTRILVFLKRKATYDTVIHELDHVSLFFLDIFAYEDPRQAQEFKVSLLTRMIQDFKWTKFGYDKSLDKKCGK